MTKPPHNYRGKSQVSKATTPQTLVFAEAQSDLATPQDQDLSEALAFMIKVLSYPNPSFNQESSLIQEVLYTTLSHPGVVG